MDIELAIRQFRAAAPEAKLDLYGQIAREIQLRLPDLRDRAKGGLSPKARVKLQQYDDGDLLSRLIEQLVEDTEVGEVDMIGRRRKRRATYDPVDGKFNSYASDHIRRFIKNQMKPDWTPVDKTPEAQTPPNRVPTNTLPMDEIHGVLEKPLMAALNSVTNIKPETKILSVIDQMPPNAVSPTIFDALCRQAGLSEDVTAKIIQLTSEKPDNYARQVEQILDISQSAACRRVERAVPHLLDPLQDVMIAARKDLEPLRNPPPHTNGDPFFADD